MKQELIGKEVIVLRRVNDGDYSVNRDKFFGTSFDKVVRIVGTLNGFYMTDCFIEEFYAVNNDYIYHGYIKLLDGDFSEVK